MIGSVSPAMHKYIWIPGIWVVWHKFKALFMKKPYSMYENKIVRDYRDGKVSKEELDKCSTCDMCATINDRVSAASKAQLIGKTGEEIVDADIAAQMKESNIEMKVAVITRHAISNYGSLLQAYATQKVFEKMDTNCEIIDYIREDESYRNHEKTLLKRKTNWYKNPFKRFIYLALRQPESIFSGRMFEHERKKYLKLTSRSYY